MSKFQASRHDEPNAALTPLVPKPENVVKYRTIFNFRIAQRCDHPETNNLWDLMAVDSEGRVLELICDADSLGACVDNLSAVMEQAGF